MKVFFIHMSLIKLIVSGIKFFNIIANILNDFILIISQFINESSNSLLKSGVISTFETFNIIIFFNLFPIPRNQCL